MSDDDVTLTGLCLVLEERGAEAFVLQRHRGQWLAGIRTKAGVGPKARRPTMQGAVEALLQVMVDDAAPSGEKASEER